MISNQILQSTIEGLKIITRVDFCVMDTEGKNLASTFEDAEQYEEAVLNFAESPAESQVLSGNQFFKVFDDKRVDYVVITGENEGGEMAGRLVTFQLAELTSAYRDRLDKDNFIKNLLLDNLLLVDIYSRAKKLHIEMEDRRVVILVKFPRDHDGNEISRIKDTLQPKNSDFVTAVTENSVVIVTCLEDKNEEEDIEAKAEVILDGFQDPLRDRVRISYGSIVTELKEVSKSYKEAIMAMEIGEIFFKERQIVAYSELGIGRLVYQLPIPLCKMFIKEIFKDKRPDDFDDEMLATINKFFENSLNVSETSRQLYIHRNTLVYRLDKLQKFTGLDLRTFEDAITFKIAMMVVEYMRYMETERQ